MRERDMRERIERFLRGRLRSVVVPPALGLGLALATSCKATAPDRGPRPASVYDFADDCVEGCGGPRPEGVPIYSAPNPPEPGNGPPLPPPVPEMYKSSPEAVAREIKSAIESCAVPKLRGIILGYAELSSLAQAPPTEADYAETIARWLATHTGSGCASAETSAGPRLGEPNIKSVVSVAGMKWKRPFTLVTIAFPLHGQAAPGTEELIHLMDFDGDWRILVKAPAAGASAPSSHRGRPIPGK